MYRFLRVGNLIWLLFSAVTVEVTLNFNHVHGVLGGRHDGGLQLPSQLLPFLVGLFSFLRIMYVLLKAKFGRDKEEEKNNTGENKKSDDTGSVIEAAVIVVPDDQTPTQLESGGNTHPPRADSYQIIARSLPVRYLVGWLPWLGLVVHPETASKSHLSTIVERGAGLTAVGPAVVDPRYRAWQQQWNAEDAQTVRSRVE